MKTWNVLGSDEQRIVALAEALENIKLEATLRGAVILDGSFVHLFFESAGATWYRLDFGLAGPPRPGLRPIERWALDVDEVGTAGHGREVV